MRPDLHPSGAIFRVDAAAADLLAALHAQAFAGAGTEPWDAVAFHRFLVLPGMTAFVGQSADQAPAGFVLARIAGGESEIITIGVTPEARRSGLARRLAAAVIADARHHGAQSVFLEVADDNHAAQALYAGLGFAATGRRPGYYRRRRADGSGDERLDAIVMSRHIV